MPPTFPPRPSFRRLTWLALPALALAGCGISAYEQKMQEAEVRLDRFDAENEVLGDPLALPPHKDTEGPPFDVFLRPPRGVASKDKTQPGELPYHYPANGGLCTDLYLTFGNVDEGRDKLEKQIEAIFGVPPQNWQAIEITHPFGRPAIPFDRVEFADPRAAVNCIVYVHQEPSQPAAAVVFRVLQAYRSSDSYKGSDDILKSSCQALFPGEEHPSAAKMSDAILKMSMQTYAERDGASKARRTFGKPLEW